MTKHKLTWNWLKILTHLGALSPLALIAWDFWQGNAALWINPFQEVTFRTGKAALILLILSLTVTPLNTLFGWRQLIPLRKILGLYAFFYVSLHFLIFIVDNGLFGDHIELGPILAATFEKRFAFVGFAAFLILLPLAITSTKGWMKRLGRTWKRLHRLVYLAGGLAIIHYVWLVKSDYREPLVYGFILGLLLLARVPQIRRPVSQYRLRLRDGRRQARRVVNAGES
jgi:sulfoxide reductase heme-binding subunit YedZ